jgi:RNA polymerase sigma-70 factor, ECF subfamily
MSLPEIEQLFKEHYEALFRYAFSILKNEEDAKDVLQIVFINLWERRDTLHINSSPKAYLYRAVYNESLNYIKKESVRHKHETGAFSMQENVVQEEVSDSGIWQQKMDEVLEQMPPQCKTVFLKSRIENKKYAEIAAELDISVKTVEAHMSKALKIIRATIGVLWLLSCLPLESLK